MLHTPSLTLVSVAPTSVLSPVLTFALPPPTPTSVVFQGLVSQGTYPPLPFREVAVYTDVYPALGLPGFYGSFGVAVDSTGRVYIASLFDSTMTVLFANHTVQRLYDYNSPLGLAVDSSDNLYVISLADHVVRKFAPNGTQVFSYSNAIITLVRSLAVDRAGLLYVTTSSANKPVYVFNTDGTQRTTLQGCTATCYVTVNAARDTVYVSSGKNYTIYVYNASTLARTATVSTGDLVVSNFAVTSAGKFYVRSGSYNVYELDRTGAIIADLSFYFISPAALAISPTTDQVYVVDLQRAQVDVFYPQNATLATIYRAA